MPRYFRFSTPSTCTSFKIGSSQEGENLKLQKKNICSALLTLIMKLLFVHQIIKLSLVCWRVALHYESVLCVESAIPMCSHYPSWEKWWKDGLNSWDGWAWIYKSHPVLQFVLIILIRMTKNFSMSLHIFNRYLHREKDSAAPPLIQLYRDKNSDHLNRDGIGLN